MLSFASEQRLADDLAFISAAQEGVESVAAVCIEEKIDPPGLTLRIAANEGVKGKVRDAMTNICDILASCAMNGTLMWLRQ